MFWVRGYSSQGLWSGLLHLSCERLLGVFMKDEALFLTGKLLVWQINLALTRVISAAMGQPDLDSSLPKGSSSPVPSKSSSFRARPPPGPLPSFLPSLRACHA